MILALIIALSSATASAPTPIIDIGEKPGSIEVMRCHFAGGRIVIRLNDELHVLHEGDQLDTTGLTVIGISLDSATLAIRGPGPAGHLRIFRVTNPSTGVIHLRELSTDPAALASTDTAKTAPIATKRDVAPGPPSDG